MPADRDRVQEFYDLHARNHPGMAGMLGVSSLTGARYRMNAEARHFFRIVHPQPDWTVLDLGCGAGRWEFLLAPRVRFIRGVDFSRELIEIARQEQARLRAGNVEFVQASVQEFEPSESYDLIYFSSVLNYLGDDEVAVVVRRMAAVLKPGGVMLSRDTVRPAGRKTTTGEVPTTYRSPAEYHAFFEQAGFMLAYSAESFRWPRLDGRFQRYFPESFQSGWPRASMAAFITIELAARAAVGLRLLKPGDREHQHRFMLFTRSA